MGVGYLYGNGGGGGVGGILTVTAPAGVAISVEKDGKVKRKTVNTAGVAIFKGLDTGTWLLTITDGEQTAIQHVNITADYNAMIAFFTATISITYPAGSTCTCSDGVTTLTAPDTSGTWNCIVPNAGTWTVSCTDGVETAEDTVEITADGQTENVALDYVLRLYNRGDECTDVTGGWYITRRDTSSSEHYTKTAESLMSTGGSSGVSQGAFTASNPIDLSKANTIIAVFSSVSALNTQHSGEYGHAIGLKSSKLQEGVMSTGLYQPANLFSVALKKSESKESSQHTLELDVSSLSGTAYLSIWFGCCSCECLEVIVE